jgi:hypothetical protein
MLESADQEKRKAITKKSLADNCMKIVLQKIGLKLNDDPFEGVDLEDEK